jgi:hypothetical protein
MVSVTKKSTFKSKPAAAIETQRSIEEQTAAFLKCGGQVQQIPNGVTGQVNLAGPRHITLGKKPEATSS